MEQRLKQFRAELVNAIIRYAEEKTAKKGEDEKNARQRNQTSQQKMKHLIKKLPKNRSEFCRNLYNDIVVTEVHWLTMKKNIEARFKNELITGLFGRSQLRKYVREVMNRDEHTNDALFLLEIKDLKNTNKGLSDQLERYRSGFNKTQLYTRNEMLEATIKELTDENERLTATINTLNADNLDLLDASRYEKPVSPVKRFLTELSERSIPSPPDTGGYVSTFFSKPKNKKATAPVTIETPGSHHSSEELNSLYDELQSGSSTTSVRSSLN